MLSCSYLANHQHCNNYHVQNETKRKRLEKLAFTVTCNRSILTNFTTKQWRIFYAHTLAKLIFVYFIRVFVHLFIGFFFCCLKMLFSSFYFICNYIVISYWNDRHIVACRLASVMMHAIYTKKEEQIKLI